MARIAKSPVPVTMYRHFAVVTVCLTFALAIFADGENRTAMAEELDEQQQQAALRQQSADMVGTARIGVKKPGPAADPGGFGEDESMGAPSAPVAGGGSSSSVMPEGPGLGGSMAAAQSVGFPQAHLAAMSQAERDQLVKGLRDAGMLSPQERRRRAAALLAVSRSRSGVSDTSDVDGAPPE